MEAPERRSIYSFTDVDPADMAWGACNEPCIVYELADYRRGRTRRIRHRIMLNVSLLLMCGFLMAFWGLIIYFALMVAP